MNRLGLLAPLAAALVATAAQGMGGEMLLRADGRDAAAQGPLALAGKAAPRSGATLQIELHDHWQPTRTLGLHGNVVLGHERQAGGGSADLSRVNEAHLSVDLGAWQLSAGRKVLGWDVGWAWRPNDLVQQEPRRAQLGRTPQGRTLLMVEHFGSDSAWSAVWVEPGRWRDAPDRTRLDRESAFALRGYRRLGALDLHGFARHGRHTGASAGAALAWVAGDELALHASARVLRRHDALVFDGVVDQPAQRSPWRIDTHRGGTLALVGAQWTGGPRLSLLAEAWHDGSAPPDALWCDWTRRNQALSALALAQPALAVAAAGNLAWQAEPLALPQLRRDQLFVRMAWQPEGWLLSLDTLYASADRGRIVTAALQWQGERWRIDASWRHFGGPAQALYAQLPLRRSVLLAATLAF